MSLTFTVDESRYNLGLAKLRAVTFLMERTAESQLADDVELATFGDVALILADALTELSAAVQSNNSTAGKGA